MPNSNLSTKTDAAQSVLNTLLEQYSKVAFANSLGAEDMVLTDIIARNFPDIEIFSLDTGRLPNETYDLMQKIESHYALKLKLYYPDTATIESYAQNHGINAFYQSVELRKQCCHIRKVEPLNRALHSKDAWITGMRRSQSITRSTLPEIEFDEAHGLHKANPLAIWEESDVWEYIKNHNVPYNALHDKHYPSIGCAPCTRAIAVGEDIRAGRWWWENPESKECGINTSDVSILKS